MWLAPRIGATHQQIVLAACACARTALRYIPEEEERPLMAIEAAEAWARGEASIEEVSAAVRAADIYGAASRAVDTYGAATLATAFAALAAVNAARAVRDADTYADTYRSSRAVAAALAAVNAARAVRAVAAARAAVRAAEIDQDNRVANAERLMCDKIREILTVVRFPLGHTHGLLVVSVSVS
jgi:hypothetical protein